MKKLLVLTIIFMFFLSNGFSAITDVNPYSNLDEFKTALQNEGFNYNSPQVPIDDIYTSGGFVSDHTLNLTPDVYDVSVKSISDSIVTYQLETTSLFSVTPTGYDFQVPRPSNLTGAGFGRVYLDYESGDNYGVIIFTQASSVVTGGFFGFIIPNKVISTFWTKTINCTDNPDECNAAKFIIPSGTTPEPKPEPEIEPSKQCIVNEQIVCSSVLQCLACLDQKLFNGLFSQG